MKKLTRILTSISLLAGILVPALLVSPVVAANSQALCQGSGGTWTTNVALPNGGSCSSSDGRTVIGTIQQLTDVLVFIVGAVAVVMLIVGGLRYVMSAGDQAGTTGAKNTILYAIIGIIVAFTAYAIVHFVFAAFNIR